MISSACVERLSLNKSFIKIIDSTIDRYNLGSNVWKNDITECKMNIIHEPDVTISKEINEDYRAWVTVTSIINAVL